MDRALLHETHQWALGLESHAPIGEPDAALGASAAPLSSTGHLMAIFLVMSPLLSAAPDYQSCKTREGGRPIQ